MGDFKKLVELEEDMEMAYALLRNEEFVYEYDSLEGLEDE